MESMAGLTPSGRSALIQAANPFSDFEFDRAGFWDSNEAASVVQCIKSSTVVTSTGPGNWDCHIATLPLCGHQSYSNYTDSGVLAGSGMLITQSGILPQGTLGPINVLTGASGSNLSLVDTTSAVVSAADQVSLGSASDIAASFLDGTSRVIGMGFEVHNTTAEIYKQGSVAVYKQPQNHFLDRESRQEILAFGGLPYLAPASIEVSGSLSNYTLKDIPGTLSDVLKLSGSRQWTAAEGCMVIPTFISEDIQPTRREAIKPVVVGSETFQVTLNTPAGPAPYAVYHAGAAAVGGVVANHVGGVLNRGSVTNFRNKFMNYNTSGAFFTGLSKETSLTLNAIYYIERFPTPAESDLVVIAQPSPSPDPVARMLYAEMMRTMPPGVKVADNADGDWFYELVSGAAKFLQPALMAAGPLGVAGSALASGADAWAQSKLLAGKTAQPQAKPPPQQKKQPPKKSIPPPKSKVVTKGGPGSTWAEKKKLTNAERKAVHKALAELGFK
jgi:hypothetical protein